MDNRVNQGSTDSAAATGKRGNGLELLMCDRCAHEVPFCCSAEMHEIVDTRRTSVSGGNKVGTERTPPSPADAILFGAQTRLSQRRLEIVVLTLRVSQKGNPREPYLSQVRSLRRAYS